MPKNVETTTQLHSPHTLPKYMNQELQVFKLYLEKAEEPEIKLPKSTGS